MDITVQGNDARWNFFKRSTKDKDGDSKKTNRCLAQCTLCLQTMDGRLDRMSDHMFGKCEKATVEQRNAYRLSIENAISKKDVEEKQLQATSANPKENRFYPKRKFNPDEQNAYADSLTAALITGNIAPRFVENGYFRKSIQLISQVTGMAMKPLTIDDVKKSENRLWTKYVQDDFVVMDKDPGKTLCLDNWRDSANLSHEAIVFDKVGDTDFNKFFFDTLASERERKTSLKLYELLNSSLQKVSDSAWDRISAMCTDSPSSMVKLRSIVESKHPHVIVMGCVLHVLSLLTKDCIKFPSFMTTMKENMAVVQFFKRSEIWSEILSYYERSQLIVFIKTR